MLETLCALWDAAAELPRSVAFATPAASITYAELAARAGGLARRLGDAGPTIGLQVEGIDGVVAELAVAAAGGTAVPLPSFFAPGQIDHIVADAGIDCVIAAPGCFSPGFGSAIPVLSPDAAVAPLTLPERAPARIVYTSGTSGRPKGVRLGAAQIDLTCGALQAASGARADDRHMSVLPISTLLETICGVCLPIRVGACSLMANDDPDIRPVGDPGVLIGMRAASEQPTTTVLTPQLLAAWVSAIERGRVARPSGLRFVAVGGAPAGSSLLARAWAAGIPVYEGYGLTETCSVVSMNLPGAQRIGTVGRPLPHVDVAIECGEIVVRSDAVMDGYLGGRSAGRVWRTGDVGKIDADGFLTIHGRKDNVIVLANGRKISPEWVEAEIANDQRIAGCMVYVDGTQSLAAMIAWSDAGRAWADNAAPAEIHAYVEDRFRDLPAYARPANVVVAGIDGLVALSKRCGPTSARDSADGPELGGTDRDDEAWRFTTA